MCKYYKQFNENIDIAFLYFKYKKTIKNKIFKMINDIFQLFHIFFCKTDKGLIIKDLKNSDYQKTSRK